MQRFEIYPGPASPWLKRRRRVHRTSCIFAAADLSLDAGRYGCRERPKQLLGDLRQLSPGRSRSLSLSKGRRRVAKRGHFDKLNDRVSTVAQTDSLRNLIKRLHLSIIPTLKGVAEAGPAGARLMRWGNVLARPKSTCEDSYGCGASSHDQLRTVCRLYR